MGVVSVETYVRNSRSRFDMLSAEKSRPSKRSTSGDHGATPSTSKSKRSQPSKIKTLAKKSLRKKANLLDTLKRSTANMGNDANFHVKDPNVTSVLIILGIAGASFLFYKHYRTKHDQIAAYRVAIMQAEQQQGIGNPSKQSLLAVLVVSGMSAMFYTYHTRRQGRKEQAERDKYRRWWMLVGVGTIVLSLFGYSFSQGPKKAAPQPNASGGGILKNWPFVIGLGLAYYTHNLVKSLRMPSSPTAGASALPASPGPMTGRKPGLDAERDDMSYNSPQYNQVPMEGRVIQRRFQPIPYEDDDFVPALPSSGARRIQNFPQDPQAQKQAFNPESPSPALRRPLNFAQPVRRKYCRMEHQHCAPMYSDTDPDNY